MPAIATRLWSECVPFLQFDREIRRIVCMTNAIKSVNARILRAVTALDPTGQGEVDGAVEEGVERILHRVLRASQRENVSY